MADRPGRLDAQVAAEPRSALPAPLPHSPLLPDLLEAEVDAARAYAAASRSEATRRAYLSD